jgi:hypothetical protein
VRTLLLLVLAVVAYSANGQTADEKRVSVFRAEMEKRMRIEKRIRETRPARRESPIRLENIDDDEVREIQRLTSARWPGAIVNIGTVVVGCPCEDGPDCSDQVWIVGHRPTEMKGLLFSKIKGRWSVGPVQSWWLEYEQLGARRSAFRSSWEHMQALADFWKTFPACTVASVPAHDGRPGNLP